MSQPHLPSTTTHTDCKATFSHQNEKNLPFPDVLCQLSMEQTLQAPGRHLRRWYHPPLLLQACCLQAHLFSKCCSLSSTSDNLCSCPAIAFSASPLTELEKSHKNGLNCCSSFFWVANSLEYQWRGLHTWTACLAQLHLVPAYFSNQC